MSITRRRALQLGGAAALLGFTGSLARADAAAGGEILRQWYKVVLHLVRHTATYSPPVASRAFAYLGVAAYEAVAGGRSELRSLAGQLRELAPPPSRDPALLYDEAALLHEALAAAAGDLFSHTGPTGQRAMAAMTEKTRAQVAAGKSEEVLAPSRALGAAIAAHLLAWARSDGGAGIANAVQAFVTRKMGSIATLKCLGASSRDVMGIYLTEIILVALVAIALGLAAGAIAPPVITALFGQLIPVPLSQHFSLWPLAYAGALGLLTTLAFALWPLAHARRVEIGRAHV